MKHHKIYILAILIGILTGANVVKAVVTPYSAPIVYEQTNTLILDKEDLNGWPENDSQKDNDYRQFTNVLVSSDGTKILYSACAEFTDVGTECRPFVANIDGTGLQDASEIFPSDIVSRSWGWGNMRINDTGSRFFIKAHRYEFAVIDETQVWYYDISDENVGRAEDDGFWPPGFDWFNINTSGSRLYHGKYDDGPSEGLWYTDFGDSKNLIFDVNTLPCDSGTNLCDNLNGVAFLGSAALGDRNFFSWMSYYESNNSTNNRSAMWYTDLAGNKQKLTDEDHFAIWSGDWRGTCNADGTVALYGRTHTYGDPYRLYTVNVATKAESLITWTSDLNGMSPFITRSGKYVFVKGSSGDYGFHYHTLFDLQMGTSRDSWSYHLPNSGSISNMTENDRYYFATTPAPGTHYQQYLYKVDTSPGPNDFGLAPKISSINFSSSTIRHDIDPPDMVAVTASVSDSQGLDNIDWVLLLVLVDGAEEPPWAMAREPLAFPSGDPGSTWLYDDGTHGDETAGDGIFTFDSIATRKGDYDGFNTWYNHYTLPHTVGIRIIAKDKDDNYTIADTTLTITDRPIIPISSILTILTLGN